MCVALCIMQEGIRRFNVVYREARRRFNGAYRGLGADFFIDRVGELEYILGMPELSRFLGIVVYMLFNEHNPPHFHVEYGEYKASISINDLALVKGDLP